MLQASNFKSKVVVAALAVAASAGTLAQQADKPSLSYAPPGLPGTSTVQVTTKTPEKAVAGKPAMELTRVVTVKETQTETPVKAEKAEKPHAKHLIKKSKSGHRSHSAPAHEEEPQLKFKAPTPGEVEVSDRDLNHFIFPSAITNLIFPPNAPVEGKPVYLNGNTQVLIQFQRGADKAVQMIAETETGRVTKLYVHPRPINGITYRVDGAREAGAKQPKTASKSGDPAMGSPHGEDIEMLKRAVQGDIPSDFDAIALPRPTRFDRFTVVPLAGWSNGSRRIMSFSLVAVPGKTAIVSDPQFYRPGITAVMLTGDHVDESTNPKLFVIEEVSGDE